MSAEVEALRHEFERARTERDRCAAVASDIGDKLARIDVASAQAAAKTASAAFDEAAGRHALGEADADDLTAATVALQAAESVLRQQRAAVSALTRRLNAARAATETAQRAVKLTGTVLAQHLYRAEDRRSLVLANQLFESRSLALRLRHYAGEATYGMRAALLQSADESGGIPAIARLHGLDHTRWSLHGGELPRNPLTEADVSVLDPAEVADDELPRFDKPPPAPPSEPVEIDDLDDGDGDDDAADDFGDVDNDNDGDLAAKH